MNPATCALDLRAQLPANHGLGKEAFERIADRTREAFVEAIFQELTQAAAARGIPVTFRLGQESIRTTFVNGQP